MRNLFRKTDFWLFSHFIKATLTLSEADLTYSEADLKHSDILASTLFQNQLFHAFQPFISELFIQKYIITYFYDLIEMMTAPGNLY